MDHIVIISVQRMCYCRT